MKPILFSTPMVQAILEGRKTMTRRVIKPQPYYFGNCIMGEPKTIDEKRYSAIYADKTEKWILPKYVSGDILWVRETWRVSVVGLAGNDEFAHICYKIGEAKTIDINNKQSLYFTKKAKWQPSIFMPRDAARIYLEVKSVRVEQLREITDKDKISEGFCGCCRSYPCAEREQCEDLCFMKTWDSLNAKRGYSWGNNVWVWVYEFMRVEKPEGDV